MTRAERYQAAIAALSAVQTPFGLPGSPAAPVESGQVQILQHNPEKRKAHGSHALRPANLWYQRSMAFFGELYT